MSAYELEVADRCGDYVVDFLRDTAIPQPWLAVRKFIEDHGEELEPAYQGRLIDSVTYRMMLASLLKRRLVRIRIKNGAEWWQLGDPGAPHHASGSHETL